MESAYMDMGNKEGGKDEVGGGGGVMRSEIGNTL